MSEKRTRRKFLAVTAAVGTTAVAGCSGGGGEDTEDDEETEPPEETTPPATPTPEEETPTPTPEDDDETPTPEEEETPEEEPEPSANVDPWPMARYDARNTGRNTETSGPKRRPTKDWEVSLDAAPVTMPIVSDSAVYIGTAKNTFYALSPEDGTELWLADLPGRPSTPAVGNGKVYVPHGGITAFEAETGDRDWVDEGNGARGIAPAAYVDGEVFAAVETANGFYEMYAVQSTGREQWVQTDLSVGSGDAAPTAIAADGGQLYVATNAPGVLLLETSDGGRAGTLDIGPSPGIAIGDDVIAYGGREIGIWDRSGEQKRGTLSQRIDGVSEGTAPVLTDQYAIHGTQTGVNAEYSGAMGVGLENATFEWEYGSGRVMRFAPAAGSEMLYAPAKSTLYGIRTFGAGEWSYDLGNEARTSPAVSSGRVFIGTTGPKLIALTE